MSRGRGRDSARTNDAPLRQQDIHVGMGLVDMPSRQTLKVADIFATDGFFTAQIIFPVPERTSVYQYGWDELGRVRRATDAEIRQANDAYLTDEQRALQALTAPARELYYQARAEGTVQVPANRSRFIRELADAGYVTAGEPDSTLPFSQRRITVAITDLGKNLGIS